jgi:hypothetical protein
MQQQFEKTPEKETKGKAEPAERRPDAESEATVDERAADEQEVTSQHAFVRAEVKAPDHEDDVVRDQCYKTFYVRN